MRYYLGVHKFAPVVGMQGDLGWLSPRYRRFKCILRYWNRLLDMSNDRLTKHVFNSDYLLCNNNWSADVKCICRMLDIDNVFDNRTSLCSDDLVGKLHVLDEQEWLNSVHRKPKLRTYLLFKNELKVESYVKYYMHKRRRSLLAQFRLGILPLRIETGRYSNTPADERICQMCNLNSVEDEYHFVMNCPLYDDLRTNLFHRAQDLCENFNIYDQNTKFEFLFETCHKILSQYIIEAYQRRQNTLYS